MQSSATRISLPLALLLLLVTPPRTDAPDALAPDEGMWAFHDLPLETLEKRYGFRPTEEWLEHLRLASVKVSSGGSGSFVSSNGLVATNHHVALDFINKLSTKENDLVEHGFLAKNHAEELKCQGATLSQLVSYEDVSTRVFDGAKDGKKDSVISDIEKEESARSGLQCSIVALHGGAQHWLYRYKIYDDVRLVFAPEKQIAYFGGDRDNFCYPRWCLDCSFLRAYENDKPAETPQHLTWSSEGVKAGDLIFISGNPASTGRYLTMGRLQFERDTYLPAVINILKHRDDELTAYAEKSDEKRIEVLDEVFSYRNSFKAYSGNLRALRDPHIWDTLARNESIFQKALGPDEEAKSALESIRKGREDYKTFFDELILQRLDGALGSLAMDIVATASNPKALEGERGAQRIAALKERSFNPELETHRLAASFKTALEGLGGNHHFTRTALRGKTPEEAAKDIVANTVLAEEEGRGALVTGGQKALNEAKDPLIKLALLRAAGRSDLQARVLAMTEKEDQAMTVLANARFRVHGKGLYPDATFTLRLSFGQVAGYELGTTDVPWKTNLWGLFARSSSFDNTFPYELPQRWAEARPELNMDTPVNFVSTADTTGGNSGSPVVARNGHIVGLLFDGNIQSLLVDNLYEEKVARSVCVDVRFISHALARVYRAYHLLAELGAR